MAVLCAFLILTPRLGNRRSSVNRNYHAVAGGSVGQSRPGYRGTETGSWAMKAALLAVVVLTVAGMALHFASSGSGTTSAGPRSSELRSSELRPTGFELTPADGQPTKHPVSASSLSFPLFFEPNVGQTDGRVKFLAHGSGYGLFLTADE